jgi:dihydropteroate synthase
MNFNARIIEVYGEDHAIDQMQKLKVHPGGFSVMSPKFRYFQMQLEQVDNRAAAIIKQEALSLGGEAIISEEVSRFLPGHSQVLLLGTEKIFMKLIQKLSSYPFPYKLQEISQEISHTIANYKVDSFCIPFADGSSWDTSRKTYIMGILNVTPDSFSDGGQFFSRESALKRAEEMLQEGADIIDVGGESTRPYSEPVPLEEELQRVIPVIEAIKEKLRAKVSIDTYKKSVAREAIEAGADMINDISGLTFERDLASIAAKKKVPLVLMHIKGKPKTMQDDPHYENLMSEIASALRNSSKRAAEGGVKNGKIIIDPGIGFGKTVEHNLEILNNLRTLKSLGHPILVGLSRKSFIGHVLQAETTERLEGGLAAAAIAIRNGASLLRVHDVKEFSKAARMADAITKKPI